MRIDGTRLKKLREGADLRLADIAVAADLSERRIGQIEAGKLSNVNLNIAKAIAKRLGAKLEDLAQADPEGEA
ncbi:MAG: hypothetical protein B7Z25_01315, partial [Aerococcus viridans]